MSQTFTCTKEHSVTLPENAIYDYISEEYIPCETVMEVKDDLGRVQNLEYETKRKRRGLMLAWPDEEKKLIRIGYSRCHDSDEFNMVDAISIAMERGMSKNEYIAMDEVKEFEIQFNHFRERVKKYYKQLMYKEWHMFKCGVRRLHSPCTKCNHNLHTYITENLTKALKKYSIRVHESDVAELFKFLHTEAEKVIKNKETTIKPENKKVCIIINEDSWINSHMVKFEVDKDTGALIFPGNVTVTIAPKE